MQIHSPAHPRLTGTSRLLSPRGVPHDKALITLGAEARRTSPKAEAGHGYKTDKTKLNFGAIWFWKALCEHESVGMLLGSGFGGLLYTLEQY